MSETGAALQLRYLQVTVRVLSQILNLSAPQQSTVAPLRIILLQTNCQSISQSLVSSVSCLSNSTCPLARSNPGESIK